MAEGVNFRITGKLRLDPEEIIKTAKKEKAGNAS